MKKQALTISLLALTAMPASAIVVGDTSSGINCATLPSCADLGFNEVTDNCPDQSNALKCPFDLDKAKCMHTAPIGQIGYFPKNPGGGWLACDGLQYNKSDYPELAAALGKTSSTFNVPNYNNEGVFLRAGTEASTSKQSACLPNVKGTWHNSTEDQSWQNPTGAVSREKLGGDGVDGDEGWFDKMTIDASRSSSVYKNDCKTPVPDHYTLQAYIYSGRPTKTGTYIKKAWEIAAECQKGQYYYSDYHCSSSPNDTSGSVMGIVSDVTPKTDYTIVYFVFGGGNGTDSDFSYQGNGAGMCQDIDLIYNSSMMVDGTLANIQDIKNILPSGVSSGNGRVHGIYQGFYYYYMSEVWYCSTSSPGSCGYHNPYQANGLADPGTAENPYYYCKGYDTVR